MHHLGEAATCCSATLARHILLQFEQVEAVVDHCLDLQQGGAARRPVCEHRAGQLEQRRGRAQHGGGEHGAADASLCASGAGGESEVIWSEVEHALKRVELGRCRVRKVLCGEARRHVP